MPAAATDPVLPAASDAPLSVQVEGTIEVFSGQEASTGSSWEATLLPDEVRLITETGVSVPITGTLVDEVTSGSTFSGTLEVPADSENEIVAVVESSAKGTEELEQARLEDPIDGESALGVKVLEASETLEAPLDVSEATIAPAVLAAVSSMAHTLDVIVVTKPTHPADPAFSDSRANTLVSTLSTYWNSQTNGQISGMSRPSPVKRLSSANACNQQAIWTEAAAAFGRTTSFYSSMNGAHLVVIAPTSCGGGTGLGTVGPSIHRGGLTWSGYHSLLLTSTVAHEIGHNLGLRHSNVHACAEGTCDDTPYRDFYDVMGGGFVVNGQTNQQLPALNVTHKSVLASLTASELKVVGLSAGDAAGSTTHHVLGAASATSGVRGLRVTDPATNDVYFVEYRSGTGIDTNSIYGLGMYAGYAPGVRVLRVRPDVSSAALTFPVLSGSNTRPLYLSAGQGMMVRSGQLSVSVDSLGATAGVTIRLGTAPETSTAWNPESNRISGADRYSTAVEISKAGFPGTAPVVYLATGANYPDALGAAPAATKEGGPLLLTPSTSLPTIVKNEITRLQPARIVVVGGTGAVSNAVLAELKSVSSSFASVTRIGGIDRFATARAIVASAFGGATSAYIATGMNYPDALSASAAAGAAGLPVVLVNGAATAVDSPTVGLLRQLGVTSTTVVGGTGAVSAGIASSLQSIGPVARRSGANRFETSQALNSAAFDTADLAYFATGFQFPDALAGAALAGAKGAPLYIVQSTCVPAAIRSDLAAFGTETVTLVGGAGALSADVLALKAC